MGRYLMLDIGAGTMDILYYDTKRNLHYKAVVISPTRQLAHKISLTKGNLIITGCEMGGGAISEAIKNKVENNLVLMSKESAATIHHDLGKVEKIGINVMMSREKEKICIQDTKFNKFVLADIQPERIKQIVTGFGVPFEFDVVAVCAQDHGIPPGSMSHLDFRHKQFSQLLNLDPSIPSLLYDGYRVPSSMNRLRSIAKCALELPTLEVYVMDSGMAAILGASMDFKAKSKSRIIVLDIATSHTVGAAIQNGNLVNFFEYHTRDITPGKLKLLIKSLPEGTISHDQILKEGGHGAYVSGRFKYSNIQEVIVTGPMRHIIKHCDIPVTFGAPWGDNMMTGTTGLMEAVRINKGLKAIDYI